MTVAWGPARGLVAYYPLNGDLSAQVSVSRDGNASALTIQDGDAQFVPGPIGQAASFDGRRFIQGGDVVGFTSHIGDGTRSVSYDDPYTIAAWVYPTAATGAIVTRVKADNVVENAGVELSLKDGRLLYSYRSELEEALAEALVVQTEKTVSLHQWHHVTLSYDGSRWASGVKAYVDGEEWKWQILLDDMNEAAPRPQPVRIGSGEGPKNRFQGSIADVRIYNRPLSAVEAAMLANPTSVTGIAALAEDKRSAAQGAKIRDYFLEHAAPAPIKAAWARTIEVKGRRDAFYDSLPTVQVMEEMPTPRATHVLIRGAYDRPGEKVTPAVPEVLAGRLTVHPPNRLGLARWLVDPSNPLTARVTVNRYWQMYFGTGIVKSAENFGSQGEQPSHPELLDWLATEFVRTGWNVKALQKTIVTSATYQQASSATPALRERDPTNRLLSRGPNNRLSAEMIRDQALALAGLLVDRIGGPSVKPYQAAGLWTEVGNGEGRDRDALRSGPWGQPVPPQPVYVLEAQRPAAGPVEFRRREPRGPSGARQCHEYAAAGARSDERCGVRRSRACVR